MSRRHAALQGPRWRALRRFVFKRDGHRCRKCGKAGRLEVDHIRPLHVARDQDPYDPAGCQTLCRGCHIAKTASENQRQKSPAEIEWAEYLKNLFST
ncbi:MAG: HNH endonuclease [Gemmatimonadales bacterium]|nr:HNH endonuclease [Gemmatimonadales bacterium]